MGNRGGSRRRIIVDDSAFQSRWAEGLTLDAMAAEFGGTRSWVSLHAQRLGLPKRATNVGELPGSTIQAAYELGQSLRQIREALLPKWPTVSERTIGAALRARGVRVRPRMFSRHEIDEVAVVRLSRAGLTDREIAQRFGVHRQVVQRIARARLGQRPQRKRPQVDVRRLLALVAEGHTHVAVGQMLGCSAGCVNHHVQRSRRQRQVSA